MFIHFRWLLKIKCVLSAPPGAHKRTTKIMVSICPLPKIILASSCQAYYHCVEYSISLSIITLMLYLCCEMQKWMCLYSCPNLVHCLIFNFFVCVSVAYQHTAAFFSSKITIYVPAVAAALKVILLMFFYSISPPQSPSRLIVCYMFSFSRRLMVHTHLHTMTQAFVFRCHVEIAYFSP